MELRTRHVLQQPLERVFALLSDPRLRSRWQASLADVELLDAGEPRVGMRWRERPHGLVPFTLEIAAFERDRHWAERIESPLCTGTLDLSFERLGPDATEVRVAVELELRAGLQWSAWLVRSVLAREVRRDLSRAERVLARAQDPRP